MKKYKIKSVPSKHGAFIRSRIDKSRRRAAVVGLMYLFALAAIIAVSCLGLLTSEYAAVTPKAALVAAKSQKFSSFAAILNIKFCTAALYLLAMLSAVICLLNATTYLKNLFKKKVSRVYGLNANIDAMDSMGRMFSFGFASILIAHVLIYAFCGITVAFTTYAYVVLAIGFAAHFIGGFCGGKVSAFYIDDEKGVSESKRPYGRLIPLMRNFAQFVAIGAIGYLFLRDNSIHNALKFIETDGFNAMKAFGVSLVPLVCEFLTVLWMIGMIIHAVGSAEYSVEGPYAMGIRNFRIFSALMFLTNAASVVCQYMIGEVRFSNLTTVKELDRGVIVIAAIGFVMFVMDFILKLRWTKEAIEESENEDKPIIPNISITTPKQPINVHVPELKVPELTVHMPAPKAPELPPINIHVPTQKQPAPAPINIMMPAAQKQVAPAPITVNMPAAQKQVAPAPIKIMMPAAQKQVAPAPINVNMPAAQRQVAPAPIKIMMPAAQKQVAPDPINVNMPAAQRQVAPAPINVNIPAAQKQVAPAPINVNMPAAQRQVAPAPINITMPNAQRQVAPAPINVNMPAAQRQVAPAPINITMPNAQRQVAPAPINVNMPAAQRQVAPAPINISMPNAQRQVAPAPINVNMPAAQRQVAPSPINISMPKAQVNKKGPAPINVNIPMPMPMPQPVAKEPEPMANGVAPMGMRMEGVNGETALNPMMMPMMPPLMTMNPMMQPYPMHMNMPMVDVPVEPVEMPNRAALKEELRRELKEELKRELLQEMMVASEMSKAQEEPKQDVNKELQKLMEKAEESKKEEAPKAVEVKPVVRVVAPVVAEKKEEPIEDKEWDVSCPYCDKDIKTKPGSLLHRCPSCDKVFELKKNSIEIEDPQPVDVSEDNE